MSVRRSVTPCPTGTHSRARLCQSPCRRTLRLDDSASDSDPRTRRLIKMRRWQGAAEDHDGDEHVTE
eukprot:292891-Rhodomonas_salina.2